MGFGNYVDGIRRAGRAQARRALRRNDVRTAFVLSGGGVLGSVQVGQLEALIDAGIVPDLIVGTSVGALNGSAICADPTPRGAATLRAVWTELRSDDLFPGSRARHLWHVLRAGDHLYPNSGIRAQIDRIPARTFEDLRVPLQVCAVNLRTGKEQWFDSGSLPAAILATTALPGFFPPLQVDGEMYVDGGVVNNVPMSRAIELGAKKIYVLTCGNAQPVMRPIRRPIDVLMQAVAHSRVARVELDLQRYREHATIEMLPSPDTTGIRFTDVSHSARLIEEASTLTKAYLEGTANPLAI